MDRRTFITAILGTAIAAKILPPPVAELRAVPAPPPLLFKWVTSPHCPPDRIYLFNPKDFQLNRTTFQIKEIVAKSKRLRSAVYGEFTKQ